MGGGFAWKRSLCQWRLLWPGQCLDETPRDSDGWRTVRAPHRYWTQACGGFPRDGDNSQVSQTPRDTPGKEVVLGRVDIKKKKQQLSSLKWQSCVLCLNILDKPSAFQPAASSSPVDVGVAAADVFASSSVLHLFTLPKVILALSTWNRGISEREGHMRYQSDNRKGIRVLLQIQNF